MNLQNFRRILKPIGDRYWPKRKVQDAPAFFWSCDQRTFADLEAAGREEVDRFACHAWYRDALAALAKTARDRSTFGNRGSVQRLPFPCFILRVDDETTGEHLWQLVVDVPETPMPDNVCYGLLNGVARDLVAISFYEKGALHLDIWDAERSRAVTDDRARAALGALLEETADWLAGDNEPVSRAEGKHLIGEWRTYRATRLRPFVFELFHPANHVVRAAPAKPNNSVEWQRSRSHYLILDRKAFARVGPASGALTPETEKEMAHRAAHARRAHLRVLRHPKWRQRVGEIIHVNAAWVGPKEWIGSDGKTYVVLDKKPQHGGPGETSTLIAGRIA